MNDFPRNKSVELLLRLILPAAAILTFCTRFLPYTSPGPDDVRDYLNTTLLDHVAGLIQTGLLLLSAAGLGGFVLRRLRAAGDGAYAVGLGLGAVSLIVLLLGSLGLMGYAFLAMLVVVPALFAREICAGLLEMQRRVKSFAANRSAPLAIIMLAVILVLSLNTLRAFVPPLDYDVLEYHFGAPAQYLHDGKVHFLERNVYAAMPSNIEMLYLFGLGLKGDLIRGAVLAKLINVALGLLAAVAAGTLARRISGSRLAGVLATAAFYVFPWSSYLSTRGYVEPGMILFALLALCAFFDYFSLGEKRSAVLAGVFAGFSAGCKYPAILFLAVPMAVAFFAAHAARTQWRGAFARAAVFGAATLIVVSPWLVRNLAATGNPTYPLLYRAFNGSNWSPQQDAKWESAHRPNGFGLRSLKDSSLNFLNKPDVMGGWYLWLPILGGIVLTSLKRKWSWLLVGYVGLCFVLWYFFTHRIARFLAPWAMIAIVPAICSTARQVAWRRGMAYGLIVVTVALWTGFSFRGRALDAELSLALGFLDEGSTLEQITERATFSYRAIEAINKLPPGSRVLMVGEARTFYCETDVVAATVFDRNPLEEICNSAATPAQARDALSQMGVTHIYVNINEVVRLRWSYEFEYGGVRRPGYWDLSNTGWRIFAGLIKDHCRPAGSLGMLPAGRIRAQDRARFSAFAGGEYPKDDQGRPYLYEHAIYRLK